MNLSNLHRAKIVFVIDKISCGGAERQLIELIKRIDKQRFDIYIIVFHDGGALRSEIDRVERVHIISLNKKRRWDLLHVFFKLIRTIRRIKPDIIHSYMGVTNEVSWVVSKILNIKVIWGIRVSDIDLSDFDWVARVSFKLSAFLSRFVDLIIVNSYSGQKYHIQKGYVKNRLQVIANGIDTEKFHPDPELRKMIREEWNIPEGTSLIGIVGRLHAMKNHATFLSAAALLVEEIKNVRFVCVGNGNAQKKSDLIQLADQLRLTEKIILCGFRDDMPAVYNAMDIVSSCSAYGEGFSNVIGEAMACGRTCIATCVGDSAEIIGDCGIIIDPRDPLSLKEGWKYLLCLSTSEREALERKARIRIVERFSLDRLVEATTTALHRVMKAETTLFEAVPN